MHKYLAFAACALLLASTSAHAGIFGLTGNPAADAKTAAANLNAVNSGIGAINQQIMNQIFENCALKATFSVALPASVPNGSLQFSCDIPAGAIKLSPPAPPLSDAPAATAPAAPAAPPAAPK